LVKFVPEILEMLKVDNETTTPKSNCIRNAFFSEAINQTQSKLHRNVHWIVLYKVWVFCSDMKSKMVTTAGLSLTLDLMGKMFQNAYLIEA
jgi:hypothetical protein